MDSITSDSVHDPLARLRVARVRASQPVSLKLDPSHTSPRHERTEQFAYDIAVRQGFVGTRDEWLEYLRGPQDDTYEAHLQRKRDLLQRRHRSPIQYYRSPPVPPTPNELWLKAQQQLSADVAAELARTRAELPHGWNHTPLDRVVTVVGNFLYLYLALIALVVVGVVFLATA